MFVFLLVYFINWRNWQVWLTSIISVGFLCSPSILICVQPLLDYRTKKIKCWTDKEKQPICFFATLFSVTRTLAIKCFNKWEFYRWKFYRWEFVRTFFSNLVLHYRPIDLCCFCTIEKENISSSHYIDVYAKIKPTYSCIIFYDICQILCYELLHEM